MHTHLYRYLRILLSIVFACFASASYAVVEINKRFTYAPLEGLVYFESNEEQPDLQEALNYQGEWRVPAKSPPNFGFSSGGYWLRGSVANTTDIDQVLLLAVKYPLIDQLEIYHLQSGELLKAIKLGDLKPFYEREIPSRSFVTELVFQAGSTSELYFYLRTNSSAQLPASLWDKDEYYIEEINQTIGFGLYFGFIIIMVAYNLFLYIATREFSYVYYVLYVSVFGIFQASMSGHAYQYLWPNSPGWNNVSVPLGAVSDMYC